MLVVVVKVTGNLNVVANNVAPDGTSSGVFTGRYNRLVQMELHIMEIM